MVQTTFIGIAIEKHRDYLRQGPKPLCFPPRFRPVVGPNKLSVH